MISLDALFADPDRIPDLTPEQRAEARMAAWVLMFDLAQEPKPEPVVADTYLTLQEVAARLGLKPDTVKHTKFPPSVKVPHTRNRYSKLGLEAWDRNRRMKGAKA